RRDSSLIPRLYRTLGRGLERAPAPSRGGLSMRAASWLILAAVLVLRAPGGVLGAVKKSDSRIRVQVEEALRADDALGGSSIFVQSVHDGVVVLGGKSRNATDDLRAMADAARVPGVHRV